MKYDFLRSLGHAVQGICQVWRDEKNFRIQSCVALMIIALLLIFRFSFAEAAVVIFSVILVLGGEMFNTLVEDLLNVIEPKHHASVGKMKDMMAGIVLVLSSGCALIGALVFLHHFEFVL